MSQNDLKQVLVQDSSFMTELLDFANSYEPEYDSEDYDAPPTNTSEVQAALETLVSDAYERPVKEGVWCLDNAVPESLVDTLNEEIEKLAQASPVDYHPNSKNMVRDIVHPALFAYKNPNYENESNKRDFFGRDYEGSKFQWLPTDYLVSKDSQGERTVEIAGYINNISINRNDRDTLGLYSALEELFKYALPLFEFALGYLDMRSMFFNFEETELDTEEYEDFSFGSPYVTPRSIDSARLQVITKIVDYEIPSEGGDYSGVWHVEGMSHENIVATCLFVPYQDEGCVGGEIHFKRSMDPNELTDLYFNINQDRSEVVEDFFVQGLTILGQVETARGRLVVFPNSHVHRLHKLINEKQFETDDTLKRRRLVVFFLVNPDVRIIGTDMVGPQQIEKIYAELIVLFGPLLPTEAIKRITSYVYEGRSLKEAKEDRLELMKERKFQKQTWNIRTVELCEH